MDGWMDGKKYKVKLNDLMIKREEEAIKKKGWKYIMNCEEKRKS